MSLTSFVSPTYVCIRSRFVVESSIFVPRMFRCNAETRTAVKGEKHELSDLHLGRGNVALQSRNQWSIRSRHIPSKTSPQGSESRVRVPRLSPLRPSKRNGSC